MAENTPSETEMLAALAQKMLANPKTAARFEALAKEINPEIRTSAEAADPLLEPLREEIRKLQEFRDSVESRAAKWQQEEQFAQLRQSGYTEDGLKKIREIMVEKKLSDPAVAAAVFDKSNPPPVTNKDYLGNTSSRVDVFGVADAERRKLLLSDPEAFMEAEARDVMSEMINQ